ncbi:T-box transcription factor T-like [Argopecten irradians]|uniref:T-box transcription factor T-like n=1 Tax=Argopecten irradians TaxID=31199 RepID=UPI00371BE01A
MLDSATTCDFKLETKDLGDSGFAELENCCEMKSTHLNVSHLLNAVDSEMTVGSEKGDPTERQLHVKLEDKELWGKFKEFTNEMIVTKNGRRMFPVFRVTISGLDPNAMYTVLLDFTQVDTHRWKYVNGDWVAGGKAEPAAPNCVYIHPDSPNFGAHWMKETVTFSKVKLTNKLNGGGQIMLNSLHKYEPRVHIVKVNNSQKKRITSFSFPETQFIAVTAYQNEEITALKIKHNPFAKAFLDAKERPDQKDFTEDALDGQRSLSHLASTWYIPPGGHSLVPPPAHQFPNAINLSNAHCDRLSLRQSRTTPYPHPYQRRSPPHGGYPRDVSSNIPVLNIPDNWPHMSTGGHGMLGQSSTSAPQSQYGVWPMAGPIGNLSPNQNCAMPYLRSSAPYTLCNSTTTISSVPNVTLSNSVPTSSFETCDISPFASNRDVFKNNAWGALSPPPI